LSESKILLRGYSASDEDALNGGLAANYHKAQADKIERLEK
jgi:hypothetical protein